MTESMQQKDRDEHVCVIGLGYIGLPTAAMFASAGKRVSGVDISKRIVDAVNGGEAHFEEAGLSELVEESVGSGRMRAMPTPIPADAFVIAVPTPLDHGNHEPDISFVEAAGRSLAPVIGRGNLIVLESTSPVGTTARLARLLAELRPDLKFPTGDSHDVPDVNMAYCPERIIPGKMLQELVENDRIVGGMTSSCTERASSLYRSFVRGSCIGSDDRTAELCKLVENSFRDVNIAFANELSMICGDLGIDVQNVIRLANHHPRVNILNPGPGVGGHCIAVDPWFIVAGAKERAQLISTARQVNDSKPGYVLAQVEAAVAGLENPSICCLGLTYKADVDDFRESPALDIALALSERYAGNVRCADPFFDVLESVHGISGLVSADAASAIASADVVVVLVGHTSFRRLPKPQGKKVVDTIGFWK
ncbi:MULTISPECIES: UDP-N-acetyl-D-mannosamine dehydrogenase [unclassified Pseudoxanthomonas]|uniref:UDP-N-acetyl-D-mannosamine dehydrogenase n=1 Tax=unclassified Pseudoxanthomonas TaxID=2645906 RepID=UPI0017AAA0A6|nr:MULTISPECIES: UDP-N-acetyl-D-mannosamine dehydrogenase [unclassified Pseudoxanthomonas]MBB3275588.1 UDP-N-acetyl-D-mannosaminuronic acid dehydrogenase [Pseudoxanthomonas sp. OG2]